MSGPEGLAFPMMNSKPVAPMKIYILTDLEGAAGVSRFSQTRDYRDEPDQKQEARELLTAEVNAAVEGILDVDPDAEVVVLDGHGNGGIDPRIFHPRAKLIAHGPIRPPYFLDETYDALLFVGQHAMAGTENAPLCHTYSSISVEFYKINGCLIGEFGARAILAGSFGVPTVFLAGDDKAADEARQMVPGIVTAVVKEGLGLDSIDALELVVAIEKVFNVIIEDEDVGKEAFGSIRILAGFIQKEFIGTAKNTIRAAG